MRPLPGAPGLVAPGVPVPSQMPDSTAIQPQPRMGPLGSVGVARAPPLAPRPPAALPPGARALPSVPGPRAAGPRPPQMPRIQSQSGMRGQSFEGPRKRPSAFQMPGRPAMGGLPAMPPPSLSGAARRVSGVVGAPPSRPSVTSQPPPGPVPRQWTRNLTLDRSSAGQLLGEGSSDPKPSFQRPIPPAKGGPQKPPRTFSLPKI